MAFFIGYEAYVIFARKHPAVSVKYHLNDMLGGSDPESPLEGFTPFKYGFDVAVGLTTRNKNLLGLGSNNLIGKSLTDQVSDTFVLNFLDPSYGHFVASYDTIVTDPQTNGKSKVTS